MGAKLYADTSTKTLVVTLAPDGNDEVRVNAQIDVWSDLIEDWETDVDLRKFTFPMVAIGGVTISAGKLGTTYVLREPWQIAPYEAHHEFIIDGNLFTESALTQLILPTTGAYTVVGTRNLSTLVEVVEISGGSGLTPQESEDLATAAAESTAAAISAASAEVEAEFARKLASNRAVIAADDLSVTVFDDDGTSELIVFDVTEDKRERVPRLPDSYLWTAEGKTAVDGTDGIFIAKLHETDSLEYTTRDGVPILRFGYSFDNGQVRVITPTEWPLITIHRDFRISCLFYMDETWFFQFAITHGIQLCTMNHVIENEPGYRDIYLTVTGVDENQVISPQQKITSSQQTQWTEGWVRWTMDWSASMRLWSAKAWMPEIEPEPTSPLITLDGSEYPDALHETLAAFTPLSAQDSSNVEIAWMKYEVLS